MSRRKFHQRSPFLISIALLGFSILMALGVWQVQRLDWKQKILERIQHAETLQPVPWNEVNQDNYKDYLFHTVNIKGMWGKGPNYYVVGRTHNKRPGYHMFSIVTLPNGKHLLVNFGWVGHKQFMLRGEFPADFKGRIRQGDSPYLFMPDHKPQDQEWIMVDIEKMAQALGAPLLPYYVDYMREDTGRAPYPVPYKIDVINNHLGYAITWFALGGVWLIVFIALIHRTRKENLPFSPY